MAAKRRIVFALILTLILWLGGCSPPLGIPHWEPGAAEGEAAPPFGAPEPALPAVSQPEDMPGAVPGALGEERDGGWRYITDSPAEEEREPMEKPSDPPADHEAEQGTAGNPADEEAAHRTPEKPAADEAEQRSPGAPADGGNGAGSGPGAKPEGGNAASPPSETSGEQAQEGDAGPSEPGQPEPDRKPEPGKLVALTFDDGPDGKYTPKILDLLKEQEVPATFFLVGTQVEKFPDIVQRILEEGHSIGNHTWNHADLSKKSLAQIREQIRKADDVLKEAAGFMPVLFRAPYGAVSDTLKKELKKQGRELVGWNVDTRDWAGTPVNKMRKTVNETVRPGSIILMHSFGGKNGDLTNTLELLPLIIEDLRDQGYTFVTVEQLLEHKAEKK